MHLAALSASGQKAQACELAQAAVCWQEGAATSGCSHDIGERPQLSSIALLSHLAPRWDWERPGDRNQGGNEEDPH